MEVTNVSLAGIILSGMPWVKSMYQTTKPFQGHSAIFSHLKVFVIPHQSQTKLLSLSGRVWHMDFSAHTWWQCSSLPGKEAYHIPSMASIETIQSSHLNWVLCTLSAGFFGHTLGICKFLGQRSNTHHSCNQSHRNDSTRILNALSYEGPHPKSCYKEFIYCFSMNWWNIHSVANFRFLVEIIMEQRSNQLAIGYTANKGWKLSLDPGSLMSEPTYLITLRYCLPRRRWPQCMYISC